MNIYTVKDMPGEKWKYIRNYRMYQVSNKGRIKRLPHEKFYHKDKSLRFFPEMLMKQQLYNGYYYVTLVGEKGRKELRVNRLVADAFIDNPENLPFVNHLSEIKTDNNVENLEWASEKSNANWGTRNKRISQKNKGRKFTKDHREKISKALKGNQHRKGMKNNQRQIQAAIKAKSKPVICEDKCFSSIKEAAIHYGVPYKNFVRWIQGTRKMPQKYIEAGLRYADKN